METALDQEWTRVPDGRPTGDGRPHLPGLLVVGATGRDAGKTELACRLIGRLADTTPVLGLKVTTVERTDGHCPHGGDGCGACSSLGEPWLVTRELDRRAPKDTCRLLASGARRVYWLRVQRSELAGGAADLLDHVPPGWAGVCESNSLVTVVEPGLFLLVRAVGSTRSKPSARAVAHLADLMVASDGRSFDLDLDRITVVDGQWALRREGCAVVVESAGVRPEADGADALQRTLASLEPQFDRVLTTLAADASSGAIRDPAAGLPAPPATWCLVTPPLHDGVPPGLVNAMFRRRAGVDVVVAETRSNDRSMFLALSRRVLLPEVIAAVGRGPGAVVTFGDRCAVRMVQLVPSDSGAGLGRLPDVVSRPPTSEPPCRRPAEAP